MCDAEKRRRRADAKRDAEDRDGGVTRLACQQPRRVTEVPSEVEKHASSHQKLAILIRLFDGPPALV